MGTTLSASVKVPTLGCVPVPGSRTESLNSSTPGKAVRLG